MLEICCAKIWCNYLKIFFNLCINEFFNQINMLILGDEFETAKIILGGDKLVGLRISGAKDLFVGAHTAAKRMDIFDPVVEELLHVEQDYLALI